VDVGEQRGNWARIQIRETSPSQVWQSTTRPQVHLGGVHEPISYFHPYVPNIG